MMIKKRLSEAKSVENVEMKLKEAEIKKEKLDIEIEKTKN